MKKVVFVFISLFLLAGCGASGKEVKSLKDEIKMLREENNYIKAENTALKKEIDALYKKIEKMIADSTAKTQPPK